jgi:hypothetical protein
VPDVAFSLSKLHLEEAQENILREQLLRQEALQEAGQRSFDTEAIAEGNAGEILAVYQWWLELVDHLFVHNG